MKLFIAKVIKILLPNAFFTINLHLNGTFYIRVDRGDEAVASILEVCRQEGVKSAVFSGIGGCSSAELQVFIPETGAFETEQLEGMLELVSLNGNVVSDEAGSQKVFFKYFFVNTVTGEKSGDVLAQAKLTNE